MLAVGLALGLAASFAEVVLSADGPFAVDALIFVGACSPPVLGDAAAGLMASALALTFGFGARLSDAALLAAAVPLAG